jgi:hypothetical protein
MRHLYKLCLAMTICLTALPLRAEIVKETWDWVGQCKKIHADFKGVPGTVCHFGDSITYSNGYSQWARHGLGQTAADKEVVKWMHVQSQFLQAPTDNARDFKPILQAWKNDGFFLAAVDRPDGGSFTAQSGITTEQYLAGTYNLPPVEDLLNNYNPDIVILMLGTNDASKNRPVAAFSKDLETIIMHILWKDGKQSKTFRGTIAVLSTIPPKKDDMQDVEAYNKAIVILATKYQLPLIDYCGEVLSRHPNDWLGTLISEDGVHPSANNCAADPYINNGENLGKCGYLLRGFLTVQKVKEVMTKVMGMTLPAE